MTKWACNGTCKGTFEKLDLKKCPDCGGPGEVMPVFEVPVVDEPAEPDKLKKMRQPKKAEQVVESVKPGDTERFREDVS